MGCLKIRKILQDILVGLFQNNAIFNIKINQGNWNHLISSKQETLANDQIGDFPRPWINNDPVERPDLFAIPRKYFSSFFELHFLFSFYSARKPTSRSTS